jgi:hypothetical protein
MDVTVLLKKRMFSARLRLLSVWRGVAARAALDVQQAELA